MEEAFLPEARRFAPQRHLAPSPTFMWASDHREASKQKMWPRACCAFSWKPQLTLGHTETKIKRRTDTAPRKIPFTLRAPSSAAAPFFSRLVRLFLVRKISKRYIKRRKGCAPWSDAKRANELWRCSEKKSRIFLRSPSNGVFLIAPRNDPKYKAFFRGDREYRTY